MTEETVYVVILLNRYGDLAKLSNTFQNIIYMSQDAARKMADKLGPNWAVYELKTTKKRLCR